MVSAGKVNLMRAYNYEEAIAILMGHGLNGIDGNEDVTQNEVELGGKIIASCDTGISSVITADELECAKKRTNQIDASISKLSKRWIFTPEGRIQQARLFSNSFMIQRDREREEIAAYIKTRTIVFSNVYLAEGSSAPTFIFESHPLLRKLAENRFALLSNPSFITELKLAIMIYEVKVGRKLAEREAPAIEIRNGKLFIKLYMIHGDEPPYELEFIKDIAIDDKTIKRTAANISRMELQRNLHRLENNRPVPEGNYETSRPDLDSI